MTIPPHIQDWLEQDIKARRAKGYTPEQAARMADCFERHNTPEIRRDRIGECIATLRPVLWLLLALGATLLALHLFAVTAGNAAAPVTLLY